MDAKDQYIKAGSPDTPPSELSELAKSTDAAVRRRVAENHRAPSHTLELLASDPKPEVRIAVGLSTFADKRIIAKLAQDEHDDVRRWLASAGYLPLSLLEQLAVDANPYVADRAQRTLARLAAPSGKLINVFELLSEDHGFILNRLQVLVENHTQWPSENRSEKVAEVLDDIREHLERRHTLCDHWLGDESGLSREIADQCLADQKQIIESTSWLLAHDATREDFAQHLVRLLEQIQTHRDFIESRLFVEIKKHVPQEEIDAVNRRINAQAA